MTEAQFLEVILRTAPQKKREDLCRCVNHTRSCYRLADEVYATQTHRGFYCLWFNDVTHCADAMPAMKARFVVKIPDTTIVCIEAMDRHALVHAAGLAKESLCKRDGFPVMWHYRPENIDLE